MTNKDSKFYMGGTEGTGEYIVPLVTSRGSVGFRYLGDGSGHNQESYRIRIEPATPEVASALACVFTRTGGFKQPGDGSQNRFSTVVRRVTDLYTVVGDAIAELTTGANDADINRAAPSWAKQLAETSIPDEVKAQLVEMVQTLGLPGANLASTWKFGTLADKLGGVNLDDESTRARLVAEVQDRKVPGANLAITWSAQSLLAKVAPPVVRAKVAAQTV